MRRSLLFVLLLLTLPLIPARQASASNPFAVTAQDVTLPESGFTSASFTVSGIPEAGTVGITCTYSGATSTALKPLCGGGPVWQQQVTAGQTVTAKVNIYPYGMAVPMAGTFGWLGAALGVLLFFALRRSRLRLAAVALCLLPVFTLATGCMDGLYNGTTPGTYAFTLTVGNVASGSGNTHSASTTFNVLVP